MAITAGAIGGAIVNGGQNIASAVAPAAGAIVSSAAFATSTNTNTPLNGQLMFPNDLITDARSIYMNIYFMQYQRFSIFTPPTLNYQSGIQLPIPMPLVDSYHVEYSDEAGNADWKTAMAAAALGATGSINGALSVAGGEAAASAFTLAAGASGVQNQVGNYAGLAANPMLSVMFKSPTFKSHQFSWKFAPRSADETTTLKQIYDLFKYNMLPGIFGGSIFGSVAGGLGNVTGGTILNYPNIAIINILPNDQNMYQFMPCVITDVQLNYAPAGPSFLNNTLTSPTVVELTISLKEIVYWLNNFVTSLSVPGTIFQSAATANPTTAIAQPTSPAQQPTTPQPPSPTGGVPTPGSDIPDVTVAPGI